MGAPRHSVRIQFYVDEDLRDKFYGAVFHKFGKTSGGAISEAGTEAIHLWIKQEEVERA